MNRVLPLVFTLLCSVFLTQAAFDLQRKKAVIKTLGMCKGHERLPLNFYGFESKRDDNSGLMLVTIKVNASEEISKNLAIVFNFRKCDASGSPDTCEFVVKDKNMTNICKMMTQKNQAWTPFMEHFDKPLSCPIKPGEYRSVDLPVNTNFLKYLPIGDALWMITFQGYDGGKLISCVSLVMQVIPFLRKQ